MKTHPKQLIMLTAVVIVFTICGCSGTKVSTGTDGDQTDTDMDSAVVDGDNQIISDGDQADGDFTDGDIDTAYPSFSYTIADSGQVICYNADTITDCLPEGQIFSGQDAQYSGYQPGYRDNGDGTVTDLITGLMWQKDPGEKKSYSESVAGADSFNLVGYSDWRVPTIKELYSLILFSGVDPKVEGSDTSSLTPFINTETFVFQYGDTDAGQRIIDSQWVTSSIYESTVMGDQSCFFGVNFADGRIKCYPTDTMPDQAGYYVIYVRSADGYGQNDYFDNGDGTILDKATGLVWQQADSSEGMIWEDALAYCESLSLAGFEDWRLPNAKELQSLVDYSRSPDTTSSPAIDPLFTCSSITNEAGNADYPFYWTGTTHAKPDRGQEGKHAVYVAFGRALGYMSDQWIDVHGAGAQRSDPKAGNPADYPTGFGPQGDAIRIFNYVRCTRAGGITVDYDHHADGDLIPDGDYEIQPDGDNEPDGEFPPGPVACEENQDCLEQGACPPEAVSGCICHDTPEGSFCIPSCSTDEDCPEPPDQTLICGPDGVCVPDNGQRQR